MKQTLPTLPCRVAIPVTAIPRKDYLRIKGGRVFAFCSALR